MVGVDPYHIDITFLGVKIVDPVSTIFALIISIFSLWAFIQIKKQKRIIPFYKFWGIFFSLSYTVFLLVAIKFSIGPILNTYFNFIISSIWVFNLYLTEKGMLSSHWDTEIKKRLNKVILIQLIIGLVLIVLSLLFHFKLDIIIGGYTAIFIGVIAYLGFKYTEQFSAKFKFFWLAALLLAPVFAIYFLKINLHLYWFSYIDFSMLLVLVGYIYYYLGVKSLTKGLK